MDKYYILDGNETESLPSSIVKGLRSSGLSDGKRIRFCGVFVLQDKCLLSFPKNYKPVQSIDDLNEQDELLLFKMLEKSVGQFSSEAVELDLANVTVIDCMAKILRDFQKSGMYKVRSYEENWATGKIDWKKTSQKSRILFSSKLIPIFDDFVRTKHENTSDNELSLYQSVAIHRILKQFPFFKNLININPNVLLKVNEKSIRDDEIITQKLRLLKVRCKNRRAKMLASLLHSYFSRQYNGFSGIFMGINRFEYLWEMMLKTVIGNTETHQFPSIIYQDKSGNRVKKAGTSLRPDFITYDGTENRLGIYDAKYYSARDINNLPGSSDYIKQNYYKAILSKEYPNSEILNSFVFPGDKKHWDNLEFDAEWKGEGADIFFSKVECMFVDVKLLMLRYVNCLHSKDLLDLSSD